MVWLSLATLVVALLGLLWVARAVHRVESALDAVRAGRADLQALVEAGAETDAAVDRTGARRLALHTRAVDATT